MVRHLEKKKLMKATEFEETQEPSEYWFSRKRLDDSTKDKLDCPECGKGKLDEIIVIGRSIMHCQLCNWRSRAKKL